MSRFRNVGLWVAVIAFIPLVLQAFGIIVPSEQFDAGMKLVNGLLSLLVTAGILSNPTTTNLGFHDDRPSTIAEQIEAEKHT